MSQYVLRNPHLEDNVMAMFVCCLDADQIGRGTDEFIRTCLADLGLEGDVRRWSLEPVRSPYFAPAQPNPDYWQDRWAIAWSTRIELAAHRPWAPPLHGEVETDGVDESWTRALHHLRLPSARCLVIGDFRDEASRAAAAAELTSGRMTRGEVIGFPELTVDLGVRETAWYVGGAADGELVAATFQLHGASLYREETAIRWAHRQRR